MPDTSGTAIGSREWDEPYDDDELEPVERPFMARAMPYLLVIAGLIGFVAAFVLTVDKIELLRNPKATFACDLNPLVSCGSVMVTGQASAFGFPNSLLGIGGFAGVITFGMAMLAGARFSRWFWWGLQAGVVLGMALIAWLITQSLYKIGALCPYCMVVWVVMIALFWYVTLFNLANGHIPTPRGLRPVITGLTWVHWLLPVACYVIIALLILAQFWTYWSSLL